MGNVNETFRETLGLEITNRIARSSIRTPKNGCQDIVEDSTPSKTKKKTAQSKNWRCRSTDHSWIFCLYQEEKKDDGDKPGPTGTLRGNHLGRVASRREQREQLGSNQSL
jgi:hypothetical protein